MTRLISAKLGTRLRIGNDPEAIRFDSAGSLEILVVPWSRNIHMQKRNRHCRSAVAMQARDRELDAMWC